MRTAFLRRWIPPLLAIVACDPGYRHCAEIIDDASGAPIEGASVTFNDLEPVLSNASGQACVTGIGGLDKVTIRVEKDDYEPLTRGPFEAPWVGCMGDEESSTRLCLVSEGGTVDQARCDCLPGDAGCMSSD